MRADLPIEMYLHAKRAPSATVTPPARVRAVSVAIHQAKTIKTIKKMAALVADSDKVIAKQQKARRKAQESVAMPDGAEEEFVLEQIEKEREVREGVRSWLRSVQHWVDDIGDEARDNLIRLCELRLRGLCSASDWRAAVSEAQRVARGPTSSAPDRSWAYGAPLNNGW